MSVAKNLLWRESVMTSSGTCLDDDYVPRRQLTITTGEFIFSDVLVVSCRRGDFIYCCIIILYARVERSY